MEGDFDFTTIILAICNAGYVAMMLDYVGNNEFGWSLAQVRELAILGVLLTSAITLAGLLGGRLGKLRRRG